MAERMNAFWNCKNPFQGTDKRALCICSAGLLRSPSIAWVMGNNGYNTRAAGVFDYALIQVDEVLLEWADLLVFADKEHYEYLAKQYDLSKKPHYILDIPDNYPFKNPKLLDIIVEKLEEKELV